MSPGLLPLSLQSQDHPRLRLVRFRHRRPLVPGLPGCHRHRRRPLVPGLPGCHRRRRPLVPGLPGCHRHHRQPPVPHGLVLP